MLERFDDGLFELQDLYPVLLPDEEALAVGCCLEYVLTSKVEGQVVLADGLMYALDLPLALLGLDDFVLALKHVELLAVDLEADFELAVHDEEHLVDVLQFIEQNGIFFLEPWLEL